MTAPVIIYDTSLNKVAYLPKAFGVSYHLRANEVGRAWFSVPTDDTHLSEIQELRYAEIYDGNRRIDLFRILQSEKGQDGGEDYIRFECEHVLGTLMDDEFDDTFYAGAVSGTTAAITNILAEQGTGRWTIGTCAFSENYLYEWARGDSLLRAVLDVPKRFQEGYFWTFDTSSYPWTLNLIAPPTTVTTYVDYARNMKSIKRRKDLSSLVTKLYPHGAKAGSAQIDITSVEPSGNEYITNNVSTYGTIVHHWTDQRYGTAAELYAAAQEYLAEVSEPSYTYWIDQADLYRITGESIDLFTIGALARVDNPEVEITTDVRVMEIRKGDVTGTPGDIQITFANKGKEFDLDPKVAVNDLSNVSISDIPGGSPGALPGDPGAAGLYVTTDYLGYWDGAAWATYMDVAGRLYAEHGSYYFRFNPVAGTLSIKVSAIDISATSNVVDTQQVVDGSITNAKIDTLSVSKLTTGTLDAETITLANGGAIMLGKTSYSDNDAGFWLGEGGVNALFNIGDADNYLKWNGESILLSGTIGGTFDIGQNLDMNEYDIEAVGDLTAIGAISGASVSATTISANTTLNVAAIVGSSDVSLTASGNILIDASPVNSKKIGFDVYGAADPMYIEIWAPTGGAEDGYIKFIMGSFTRYARLFTSA